MGATTTQRRRILSRIEKALVGARLEGAVLKGNPFALFATLHPRHPLLTTDKQKRKQLAIDYLLLGRLPDDALVARGFWTVEVFSHTLDRLNSDSRSPLALSTDEAVWQLHTAVLGASGRAVTAEIKRGLDYVLIPPAVDEGDRLGSSWLMPRPLRRFADGEVEVWTPVRRLVAEGARAEAAA